MANGETGFADTIRPFVYLLAANIEEPGQNWWITKDISALDPGYPPLISR